MLNNVPRVRVLSEPWALYDLHLMYMSKQLSWPQYKKFLQAALRIQLKPDREGYIQHMVLKLTPYCIAQCEVWRDQFPNINFYFMTRNLKSTILVNNKANFNK